MAFQVGTQVRPELGRADLSGFERSGQYIGQALANLGQEIGAGIKAKQAKKEKRDTQKRRSEYIYGLSQGETGFGAALRDLGVTDEESAGVVTEMLGDSFVPVLSAVQEQIAMAEDRNALQNAVAVNTDTEGKVDWSNVTSSYIELGGSDPAGVAELTEKYEETGEVIVDPKTGIITQDGGFMGQISQRATESIPANVLVQQNTLKQIQQARQFLEQGEIGKSQDIISSLKFIDTYTGRPFTPQEFFAPIIEGDDSKGTTTDGLTPEERAEYEELKRLRNQ